MKKSFLCFSVVFLYALLWAGPGWGHGGVTPSQVITDMKHRQKGPYAAPIFRGKNLSQDWLGISTRDYQLDDVSGVLIQKLKEDGIGDSEGLERGDIIISATIGGKTTPIRSLADLDDVLATIKKPVEVDFAVIRDGERTSEGVYLVPALEEVAPEMAGIMGEGNRPRPGMMIDKMMAQTPLAKMNVKGKKIRPGMFMEDMMARSPLGGQHNFPAGAQEKSSRDLLEDLSARKLQELGLYQRLGQELKLSDEQLQQLHELEVKYKKQRVKTDARLKIQQIELEELLRAKSETDVDKLENVLEELEKVNHARHEQLIEFLQELSSIIKQEQRLKLEGLLGKD